MFRRELKERVSDSDLQHHTNLDPHKKASNLSDIILGGQDGLVNVLGVILGVAAATADAKIVVAAGMAATFAESVSMAAVAYTSKRADQSYYEAEKEREHRHIEEIPDLEREEIRQIYSRKGFKGDLLEQIVNTITNQPDVWVAVMLAEEHNLKPLSKGEAVRSSFIVGLAAIIGSFIPLIPFFFFNITPAVITALCVSALTLFVVGAYKAKSMVGSPGKSGMEMALIGMASALVGYGVGLIFKVG